MDSCGALEDYQLHIQTSATAVLSYGSGDVDTVRSTSARLLVGSEGDPDGLLDNVSALASGDRAIWFLTEPFVSPTLVAPNFVDDTGDAQTWTQNAAIAPITVPAASGNPTPAYEVVGSCQMA